MELVKSIRLQYVKKVTARVSQATAPVTPAPPVCQSSATGETIQWAALQQVLAASQSPVKRESPEPVQFCLNTQSPQPPLATPRAHQCGVHHPVNGSTGKPVKGA